MTYTATAYRPGHEPGDVVQLHHDPYARAALIRRIDPDTGKRGCDWCGQLGREHRDGSRSLFEYGTESDNGRRSWWLGKFCSVECFRAWHGE